jgi:hypothetical protein
MAVTFYYHCRDPSLSLELEDGTACSEILISSCLTFGIHSGALYKIKPADRTAVPSRKFSPKKGGDPKSGSGNVKAHIVNGTIPLITKLSAIFPACRIKFSADTLKSRLIRTYMIGSKGAPLQLLPQSGVMPWKHCHPIDT